MLARAARSKRYGYYSEICAVWLGRTSPNVGGSGHFVLFLVALYFIKLQTLPNNIPEGNPLKSVYLNLWKLLLYSGLCGLLMAMLIVFISYSIFSQ